MKYWPLILLIGCTVAKRVDTQTKVILDGSKSFISGGNGKGYITSWYWTQIQGTRFPIVNPTAPTTETIVQGKGDFAWQLKVKDNLGQPDSATYSTTIQ